MKFSVIIVNYNGLKYTRQCLESFFQYHSISDCEVIVVDNNSSDGSQDQLPRLFPSIQFIPLPENYGYGRANNIGANSATGDILFFVNNDTIFIREILHEMESIFHAESSIGIAGPKLLNNDRSFQISFGEFPAIQSEHAAKQLSAMAAVESYAPVSDNPLIKDWITGAALAIRREVFEKIKGFDERYFMYFEDIDLCKRVHAIRYRSVVAGSLELIHLGGKSYTKNDQGINYEYRRSQLRYYDKYNSLFQRIAVRVYLFGKFVPKIFIPSERIRALKTLALLFSNQG